MRKTWLLLLLSILFAVGSTVYADAATDKPPKIGPAKINAHPASLEGKILMDCINPLTADLQGLTLGHTTSAAWEMYHVALLVHLLGEYASGMKVSKDHIPAIAEQR